MLENLSGEEPPQRFALEAEGIRPDDIVKKLADLIPRDPAEKVS